MKLVIKREKELKINFESKKSFKKLYFETKKQKANIGFLFNSAEDNFKIIVKYKKRYKLLNNYEFFAVLSNYLQENKLKLNIWKHTSISDFGFENKKNVFNFIDSHKAKKGDLVLEKNGTVKLIEGDLVKLIEEFTNKILLKFGDSNDFFSDVKKISNDKGTYRFIKKTDNVLPESISRVFKRLKTAKRIANVKVNKTEKINNSELKIILANGSWIYAQKDIENKKIIYSIQTHLSGKNNYENVVVKEKEVVSEIDAFSEYFPEKHFSWKTVIKYAIFTLIVLMLMAFVFRIIYSEYSSKDSGVVSHAIDWYNSKSFWIYIFLFATGFINVFVDAFMKKKLMNYHGQKVKMRHIIISSIMGTIVSFITPLAIGGDGIGYWYLRRKGFKRSSLAATFLTSTILYQMRNILMTLIFVPMGITMFKDILLGNGPESKAILILFVVGLCWDLFSIAMIWILLFSQKFQSWTVYTSIKFIEWFHFTFINDPGKKLASGIYEFRELRMAMNKIWKSPKLLFELWIYELFPKLVSFGAIGVILLGEIKSGLDYGKYWSQLVATDVVNTANSFSLTPGSIGFIEFISINTRNHLFVDGNDSVINMDIIGKFLISWPNLGLSSLLAIIIIIGESRNKIYAEKTKNTSAVKTSTSFYKKVAFIWPIYFAAWISFIVLL